MKLFRLVFLGLFALATGMAQGGGELRFCVRGEPKNLHPLKDYDDISDTVRYLTAGSLLRINRATQKPEPDMAVSWTIARDSKSITFQIRKGVKFSDGTPFSPADVAYTLQQLLDPKLSSPLADSFRVGSTDPKPQVQGDAVTIVFPAPVADFIGLFDQMPLLSAQSKLHEKATLGPFVIQHYRPGIEILLARNPNYWKTDSHGVRLPYLDAIRLPIQDNRETELARFKRGDLHLIDTLDPALYDQLAKEMPDTVRDAGPSLDYEMMWFNQTSTASLPEYKRAWFRSQAFRKAVSEAIRRADLCRIVYHGHARPAYGPVSPANAFWFDRKLSEPAFDLAAARKDLASAGFRSKDGKLFDAQGHPVEFSLMTNSNSESRSRMCAMIQQDLAALGIKVNLTTLDFKSLIERLTSSYNYEACLLGRRRVELDPSEQMNLWLSSGPNHLFNPSQKTPGTPWEAEIDGLMHRQATELDRAKRKSYFDRVQEIIAQQQPFIFLVNPNTLGAVARSVRNAAPTALPPQFVWNAELLALTTQPARRGM